MRELKKVNAALIKDSLKLKSYHCEKPIKLFIFIFSIKSMKTSLGQEIIT